MAIRGELLAVDDSTRLQQVQVIGYPGEALQLQRLQPYGHSSVPPVGTEVLILFINGTSMGYVVADADHIARPVGLLPGDVATYSHHANVVTLTATGITLTPAAGQPVTINGNLIVNGGLTATGNVADGTGTMATMRTSYNAHTHGATPTPAPLMT